MQLYFRENICALKLFDVFYVHLNEGIVDKNQIFLPKHSGLHKTVCALWQISVDKTGTFCYTGNGNPAVCVPGNIREYDGGFSGVFPPSVQRLRSHVRRTASVNGERLRRILFPLPRGYRGPAG